jgi:hypothetical protein
MGEEVSDYRANVLGKCGNEAEELCLFHRQKNASRMLFIDQNFFAESGMSRSCCAMVAMARVTAETVSRLSAE